MRSTCAAFLLLASLCSFAKPILSGSDTDSLALVSVPLTQAHTLDGGDPPVVHQQHINRGIQRLLAAQGFPLLLNKELLAMLTNRIGLNALSPNKTDSNSHSEHLEIQAEDVGYYCPMQIGTPSRTFQLLVDTGSADLWVGAEDCQCDDGGGCGPHTFLGPRSSSSFTASNETWVIWYGTGAVSGLLVTDRVSLGGLTVDHHKFGIAQNESRDFTQDGIPFDGIFGLAQSKASRQVTPTFLQVLKDEGHIDHAIASFKIPRRSDGKDDGELTLGGMNSASYDSTHAVTVKNINERGFWQMAIDDVKVNGKSMGWVDRSAVVDTGSTLFLAPQKDVASIHRAISSSRFEEGAWLVPCNTTVSVALTIGGKDFPMNPKDIAWIPADDEGECLSGISQGGVSREGPKVWLLGDVFLKNVYFSTSQETNEMTIARLL